MKKGSVLIMVLLACTLLPGAIHRVSLAWNGAQANDDSYTPAISQDGRFVAFASDAGNLVAGDNNGKSDIFVRDLQLSTTVRVSLASDGSEANGASGSPSISADGRYVAFVSYASNLVPGDSNGANDIFVRDLQAGTTIRASIDPAGAELKYGSTTGSISRDGRWGVFDAEYLRPGDIYQGRYIFIRDLTAGTTRLFSYMENGQEYIPYRIFSLSTDRRYIAFQTTAGNVGIYDFLTGSVASGIVNLPGGGSTSGAMAPDGSFLFINFYDETQPYGGRMYDINYIFDRRSLNVTSLGELGIMGCQHDTFTDDGLWLPVCDMNGALCMFNRQTGEKKLVSAGLNGQPERAFDGALAVGGQVIAFESSSANLATGDDNGSFDIFVNDDVFPQPQPRQVTARGRVTSSQGQGLSGVTLTFAPGGQVVTNANGYYSLSVTAPWTGTITPHRPLTQFVPESRHYEHISSDITDADFAARTVSATISVQREVDRAWLLRLPYNVVTMAIANETSWSVTGLRLYRKEVGKSDMLLKAYGPADLQNNQAVYRDDAITASQAYQYYFAADLSDGETLTSPIGNDQPTSRSRSVINNRQIDKRSTAIR